MQRLVLHCCYLVSSWIFAVLLLIAVSSNAASLFQSIEKVGNDTTAELIRRFGYPAERHTVESGDGFLLTVFRIPNSGPAVLFTHGILVASDSWVIRGPKHDLAFMLADKGYDIWLADTRGNCYSHKHKNLSESDPKFWDFSFDEMGYYDVPALIDYILGIKLHSRLFYIGHSLGTTMFFAMSNTRPEYSQKISLMIGLAPAAYFSKLLFLPDVASLMTARSIRSLLQFHGSILGNELLPRSRLSVRTAKTMCGTNSISAPLCHFIIAAFFGISHPGDLGQIERRYLVNFTSVIPSGASVKTFDHLMQLAMSRKFQRYDYMIRGNLKHYGVPDVPLYDLHNVTAPVAFFYSLGDMLVPHKNVDRLVTEVKNLVASNKLSKRTFNHMDFVWGKDARKMVHEPIIDLIEAQTNKLNSNVF